MSVRIKLLLPGVLILAAATGIAMWPGAAEPWRCAWLAAGALVLLAWQVRLNERWVIAALGAAQDALAGRAAAPLRVPQWRNVVARIATLQSDSTCQHAALERAASHTRDVETALQMSEQRYLLALRGASDGLWEWDLRASRMLFSPRWKHLFGLDEAGDTMDLAAWRERLHPDDRQEAIEALEAHVRGASSHYEHPHRMLHADGSYRWVLSRGTALRRASGSVYRVVGLDTDITRLKRVESIIEAIADGTSGRAGDAFFKALVRNFARALHIDCAFITECTNRPPTRARTLAFWRSGGFDPDFEYDLAGTPCEHVIGEGRVMFHRDGLADVYPCEAGHESYLGLPIRGRDGLVIGHLAFIDDLPMPDDMLAESVYRIFTARAGVEIELAQALRRVKALEAPAPAMAR